MEKKKCYIKVARGCWKCEKHRLQPEISAKSSDRDKWRFRQRERVHNESDNNKTTITNLKLHLQKAKQTAMSWRHVLHQKGKKRKTLREEGRDEVKVPYAFMQHAGRTWHKCESKTFKITNYKI